MNAQAESDGEVRVRTTFRGALLLATFVSAQGGFLFGYDNIVISGAIGHLSAFFQLNAGEVGWAAGCALIGCLIGSATSGITADKLGLKKALTLCAACFMLSSIGVWLSASFTQYVIWRIVGGIGIGAASIVAPMYIAEMSPAAVRGRLVVFYQFGIVAGILGAVVVNMLIERSGTAAWNVQHGWRWMFFAGVIPSATFALAVLFCRESPRWLMKAGRPNEAWKVLDEINGPDIATAESKAIEHSLAGETGGLSELIRGPFRRALAIGFVLAAFTQASGITAVLSFLPDVFQRAGQRANNAFLQAVLVGLVNLLFTVVAIWLVDRAGRKTLILAGTALQTAALFSVALLYYTKHSGVGILIGIAAFVGGHAIGNGAVCWVIISEIFPTKVRGVAMSIATTAIWLSAYLANQFFPILQEGLGSAGTFWLFSLTAALNFTFVFFFVPETKGYSLEEISDLWQ